jgi:N-acetylglucosaminyl-diphospho-decaprenol L-rhamnosyltransferase
MAFDSRFTIGRPDDTFQLFRKIGTRGPDGSRGKDQRVSGTTAPSPPPGPSAQTHAPLELSVVVVNYNSWPDTARLAAALAASPEVVAGRCELLIVDNASDQPAPDALPQRHVRLIERPDNGGFAAGVNAGWRAARGRWLLLLNPDVIAGPDLIGRVLDRVADFEHRDGQPPGVVGFGLRNPDGTRQPSVGAEPSLLRAVVEPFLPRARRKYAARRARPGPVPWVTGACALVDGGLLHALGGMDEEFFLYYEEVALCRAARRLGRGVEFDPSVEVVHLRPLQNRPVTPALRVITRHSKLVFFRKYGRRGPFLAMAWLTHVEALLRGGMARMLRRTEECRAWKAVQGITRALRQGERIGGPQVRDLAAELLANPPRVLPPPHRPRRRTPATIAPACRSTEARSDP